MNDTNVHSVPDRLDTIGRTLLARHWLNALDDVSIAWLVKQVADEAMNAGIINADDRVFQIRRKAETYVERVVSQRASEEDPL